MGKGTFGQVVACEETDTGNKVAIKVIKNKEAYKNMGISETKILLLVYITQLQKEDPNQKFNCQKMIDYFFFRSHLCIVTELLGSSLYQKIEENHHNGYDLETARYLVQQVCEFLEFFKKKQIIHCDLKPENVLFLQNNSKMVNIIDFGSAVFEDNTIYTYIQSRFYRAPEVILGHKYI